MPLNIPAGYGLGAVHLTANVGSPEFITTMGVEIGEALVPTVEQANNVFFSYVTAFAGATRSGWTILKASISFGEPGSGGAVESDLPPVSGSKGGDGMPVAMAMIMRKTTAGYGRKERGRCFIPGTLDTNEVNELGSLTNPARIDHQAQCDAWWEQLVTPTVAELDRRAPTPPVLLHSGPQAPSPILHFIVGNHVGWVRSRL